jgi:TRAP-type C4-dicarboxylate transport system permease small subunit
VRKRIDNILAHLLVILMAAMVINVIWQVASRYLFNSPSGFTDELAGFLMIWVGLLGAAYASGTGLHLAIDIIRESKKINPVLLDRTIHILIIIFAVAVLVIGGSRLVYLTLDLEQFSANLKIPVGYIYLALPLSGLLITYYAISNLFSHD